EELGLGVDELPDEPGARHTIDLDVLTRDPFHCPPPSVALLDSTGERSTSPSPPRRRSPSGIGTTRRDRCAASSSSRRGTRRSRPSPPIEDERSPRRSRFRSRTG